MKYESWERNHAIWPGREEALKAFLSQTHQGQKHKWKNGRNSHSEDALTWSCFDILNQLSPEIKMQTLDELLEDSFEGNPPFCFRDVADQIDQLSIHVGKSYQGLTSGEETEVDASIELPGKLIFFEAKLYSAISLPKAGDVRTHNQIAHKLRVGLDVAVPQGIDFTLIFLDIAPLKKLNRRKRKEEAASSAGSGFHAKWKSAWWFHYYKFGRNNSLRPLAEALEGIQIPELSIVAERMGWLTWSDLFKSVLRAVILESKK